MWTMIDFVKVQAAVMQRTNSGIPVRPFHLVHIHNRIQAYYQQTASI